MAELMDNGGHRNNRRNRQHSCCSRNVYRHAVQDKNRTRANTPLQAGRESQGMPGGSSKIREGRTRVAECHGQGRDEGISRLSAEARRMLSLELIVTVWKFAKP